MANELNNAIELIGVTKEYPGIVAVDGVSFNVSANTIHGFLGPNGAGKTTTMRMIAGLLTPSFGKIKIMGKLLDQQPEQCRKLVGYLPEIPPLYQDMTVEDYLLFVAKINGLTGAKCQTAVQECMAKTGLLERKKRLIGHLSKGLKQRVGIAGCIVFHPPIIILDEPTVGLDPHSIEEIRRLILELKKETTILLSTHQLHEAHLLCDEVSIIDAGRIVQSGSIPSLQRHFQTRQVVMATLCHWTDELKQRLLSEEFVEQCEVTYQGDHIGLKVYIRSEFDCRSKLASFFVQHQCELLELSHMQLDLEDIFKLATTQRGTP